VALTTINAPAGLITLHNGTNAVIKENSCKKDSSLAIMPLYLSDSDKTDVFDYGGVTKTISFSGSYTAETTAALKTWIDSVEAIQQGHQDTGAGFPIILNDDIRGSLYVKCLSFSSNWAEAESTRITWTIKLVQSSTNA